MGLSWSPERRNQPSPAQAHFICRLLAEATMPAFSIVPTSQPWKISCHSAWKRSSPEIGWCRTAASFHLRGTEHMKRILVGLAIAAISTSAAFAAHRMHHAMKPKEAAAAPSPNVFVPGGVSAADRALYIKNEHDSGMKK
jgi:hypothetical protein